MKPNSAQDVHDIIIERLIAGSYEHGGKLPSASELALELGVHRNTVAKAYQLLADSGIVTSTRGRGTFVADLTVPQNRRNLYSSVTEALERTVQQARHIGVPRDELEATIKGIIQSVYETVLPRGLFVECNMPDIQAHISEIASATEVRLAPLLLEELPQAIHEAENTNTVVFTSLFHYREVNDYLADLQPQIQVVGVHTIPSERSLEQLASIPTGATVGVIANNPEGSKRIANLVETYSPARTIAYSAPSADEVRELAKEVDVLVSTRDQERIVRTLDLEISVLIIPFHVSPHSNTRVLEAMLGEKSGS